MNYGRRSIAAALAVAVLVLASGPSRADFQGDRKWRSAQAERLVRTYAGMRRKTSYGPGWSLEYFIEKYGPPDQRKRLADTEELLIYHGQKKLYRGSGANNVAIGREWREYRVRAGALVDESEAIQMFEMRNAVTGAVEQACEDYGGTNASVCLDVTPIETLPPATRPPTNTMPDYECRSADPMPALGTRGIDEIDNAVFRDLVIKKLSAALGSNYQVISSQRSTSPVFALGMNLRTASLGNEGQSVITRYCKKSIGLTVLSEGREIGELAVGICDRVDEISWSDTCSAKAALTETVHGLELDRDNLTLRQMGVPPRIDRRNDGSLLEYFPAIIVGRGVAFVRTSILTPFDSRQSVVIQANLDKACTEQPRWHFCTQTARELAHLQRALVERFYAPQ